MSTTITGKLNKPAHQFQAGESIGFGIRLGVRYYDRETKQKEWTNYECAIFARQPAQVKFYQDALIEGAIVTVTGKHEKIKQFQGQNGLILTIELIDVSIDFIAQSAPQGGQGGQGQRQPAVGGPAPQNQPQNQQQSHNPPFSNKVAAPQLGGQCQSPQATGFNNEFDDDIPY